MTVDARFFARLRMIILVGLDSKALRRRLFGPVGMAAIILLLIIADTISLRKTELLWSDSSFVEHSYATLNLIDNLEFALTKAQMSEIG